MYTLLDYHFFDYKYDISAPKVGMFSTPHIIFIILTIISVIVLAIATHNAKRSSVLKFIKIYAIAITVLEITKITWESSFDIARGYGFNAGGLMPIYTCSIFIYATILAGYGKPKQQEYALSFLTTISIISGLVGIIYCNGLNFYPFWTFGAFYSMFYHYSLLLVGVLLITTGYKKMEWHDINRNFIVICLMAIVAIPVNYMLHCDYMMLYDGSIAPFTTLANALAAHKLRFIFTIFALAMYIPTSAITISIVKLVELIKSKLSKKMTA